MAQQSARRGRENQSESVCHEHTFVIWTRSANFHSGQQHHRCIQRPDRWLHPTTRKPLLPLASEGASTDDSRSPKGDQG